MCNFATMLLQSQGGLVQNKQRAFQLFKQAAEKNFPRATFNVALMLERGDGVAQDKLQALEWYEKGASLGDKDSISRQVKLLKDPDVQKLLAQRKTEGALPIDPDYRQNIDSAIYYTPEPAVLGHGSANFTLPDVPGGTEEVAETAVKLDGQEQRQLLSWIGRSGRPRTDEVEKREWIGECTLEDNVDNTYRCL